MFCSRVVRSYESYQETLQCRPEDIRRLKNGYKLFATRALGRNLAREEIEADLRAAGVSEEVARETVAVLESRSKEVRSALAERSTCMPYLKDFDWRVSLIVASDKFANMATPVATFSLNVAEPVSDLELAEDPEAEEKAMSNVVVEMTRPELTRFVQQLEQMAASMRDVSI